MKYKGARVFIGWFGVLTPVFGAGVLTALYAFGEPNHLFAGQVIVVSTLNYFIGRKVLNLTAIANEVKGKKHGNTIRS
jgi:hypothetical protein